VNRLRVVVCAIAVVVLIVCASSLSARTVTTMACCQVDKDCGAGAWCDTELSCSTQEGGTCIPASDPILENNSGRGRPPVIK
jgi:hypothetical protein